MLIAVVNCSLITKGQYFMITAEILASLLPIFYCNIPQHALWLVNSASTICPWVYTADVLNQLKQSAHFVM